MNMNGISGPWSCNLYPCGWNGDASGGINSEHGK